MVACSNRSGDKRYVLIGHSERRAWGRGWGCVCHAQSNPQKQQIGAGCLRKRELVATLGGSCQTQAPVHPSAASQRTDVPFPEKSHKGTAQQEHLQHVKKPQWLSSFLSRKQNTIDR